LIIFVVYRAFGNQLPTFVIGPFLVYLFAVKLGWFSPTGSANPEDIILPAVTLGAALSAILTRMVRSRDRRTRRRLRPHGAGERFERKKSRLQTRFEKRLDSGRHDSRLAARRSARGRDHHRKDFQLAGFGFLLLDDGIGKRDYRLVQGCVLVISASRIFWQIL
jgi:hypothetical protein